MIGNYFIVAFRNLIRHKLYSFINIAGLTIGLTCAIFIILFVHDQLSYDRWIPNAQNLYRLEFKVVRPGKPANQIATAPFAAAQAMQDNIPEVQARTRLGREAATILVGNQQFPEEVDVVDPNFLEMIRLPLAAGDPSSVLAEPDSVVLSQATARKYFGGAVPIGKTIVMSGQQCDAEAQNCKPNLRTMTVTGVLRDLPHNTQFQADILVPDTAMPNRDIANWLWLDTWSYIRLAPSTNPDAVLAKFRAVIDQLVDPMKQMSVRERGSQLLQPYLTPLVDAHLTTDRFGGMTPAGSWTMVYGFGAIGALILLIACFNFTNLATARAMMRAREISLRKVVGAQRRQLIAQFLGEAMLTALIALVCALALTEILLPLIHRVAGLAVQFNYIRDWRILLVIAGIGASAGLLSGAYPALVLSGFRPADTLRSNTGGLAGSGGFRTLLVVLQFAVSIGLGIAAAVIFSQISFSRDASLGFRKDEIVIAKIEGIPPSTADSMARALRTISNIAEVATSNDVPFSDDHNHVSVQVPGEASSDQLMLVPAGPDYMKLYGIRLLTGRLLSEDRAADGLVPTQVRAGLPFNVLINAAAARRLGYSPQQAIGKTIKLTSFLRNTVTVVGVVADTKQDGPKRAAEAIMYQYWRAFPVGQMSIRLRAGHMQDGLAFIDRTWHAFAPTVAIQRHFLDDDYDRQFQSDDREGALFGLFVSIAIFIACLGLFGLAAFSTERRTREIGLRKAFGAANGDIIRMLLWQFSVPVLIANAIAWPVAWYYLHDWLQGFAYRITLSPFYFLGAGAIALVIAWATVFVHARRVANANPIYALRYE